AIGRAVGLGGIAEVLADEPEVLANPREVAAETPELAHHLARPRLDAKPAQPEDDRLEIGVETVRGDRNDLPADGVSGEAGLVVADDGLVVDVLRRDVH